MKNKTTVFVTQMKCQLQDEDLNIVHCPLIQTKMMDFDTDLLKQHYDLLVMTSKKTVDYLSPYFKDLNVDRIASIGKKTSEALESHGLKIDFEPRHFTQEGFIEEVEISKGQNILYPASRDKRPLMRDYMRNAGANVTEIPLYYPEAKEESLSMIKDHLANIDFLTLSSPSAVEALMTRFTPEDLKDLEIVAIGHVTESKLKSYGLYARTPEHETLEDMINYIKERIGK